LLRRLGDPILALGIGIRAACMKSIYSPAYRALIDWLRTERKNKGLTMREVGQRMGVPHSWIGKVETGERRLDVAEYIRLCQAIETKPGHGILIVESALGPYTSLPVTTAKAADAPPTYRIPRHR